MTTTPTSSATTIVRDSITRPVVGRSIPKASSRAFSSSATTKPPPMPTSAPSRPIASASTRTEARICAPRGAERAQHPELGDPLGDGDREGVEDQEGADEDGDEAEDEQEGLQEAEVVADFFGAAVGVFLRRLDPRRGRHRALDPPFERRRRDAVRAPRPRSGRSGRALWVSRWATGSVTWAMLAPPKEALAELGEADQAERAGAALADHLDPFAELEAGAFGRRLVERGFGRAARRVAVDVGERLEPVGQGRGDELRGEFVADLFAFGVEEAARGEDRPGGQLHARRPSAPSAAARPGSSALRRFPVRPGSWR